MDRAAVEIEFEMPYLMQSTVYFCRSVSLSLPLSLSWVTLNGYEIFDSRKGGLERTGRAIYHNNEGKPFLAPQQIRAATLFERQLQETARTPAADSVGRKRRGREKRGKKERERESLDLFRHYTCQVRKSSIEFISRNRVRRKKEKKVD